MASVGWRSRVASGAASAPPRIYTCGGISYISVEATLARRRSFSREGSTHPNQRLHLEQPAGRLAMASYISQLQVTEGSQYNLRTGSQVLKDRVC
jgi:hypothetical protein